MFRKGQTEIIGLMIVVIIIVIGGLFYLKSGVLDEANKFPEEKFSSVRQIQAMSLMNTIINLDVCENEEDTVLLKDALVAIEDSATICGGDARNIVTTFLSSDIQPLIEENMGFTFYFWVIKDKNVLFSYNQCEIGKESGIYPIKVDRRTFEAHLRLCKL